MSKFRALVEGILKEKGTYDPKYDEYYPDPDDHTGEYDIGYELDLPMNDELRKIILDQNIVGKEDLQDDQGNWLPTLPLETVIEYEIDGYPDDEEIRVLSISLLDYETILRDHKYGEDIPGTDITKLLPKDYLWEVAGKLEDCDKIELHHYDYEKQVRDDYYSSVL